MEDLLNISQAASNLGLSVPTIRKLVNDKKISVIRGTWKLQFTKEALDEYKKRYTIKARNI